MTQKRDGSIMFVLGILIVVTIIVIIALFAFKHHYNNGDKVDTYTNEVKDNAPATTFSTGKLMYEKGQDPEIALLRKKLKAQEARTREETNRANACEKKSKQQPIPGALKQGVITVVKKRPPKVTVVKDLKDFFQQTNERLLDGVQKN